MVEIELPNAEELEELKGRAFTRRVALTTAVFAVVLAIAALGGNNAMKEMLLAQQMASDQWAYYQAKATREHLYRAQKVQIEATLAERGAAMSPAARRHLDAALRKMNEEETRYAGEKKDIERQARALEHERDLNRGKDPYFDYAEVLLQIAIVLASISILAGSRPVYYFAIVSASLGALLTLNGYLLLVVVPFLH